MGALLAPTVLLSKRGDLGKCLLKRGGIISLIFGYKIVQFLLSGTIDYLWWSGG